MAQDQPPKVIVMFKQIGDAPILKENLQKVKINSSDKVARLVTHLTKCLKRDQLFIYVRGAFSPSLEDRVGALHQAYAVDGRLVVNYAITPAWG